MRDSKISLISSPGFVKVDCAICKLLCVLQFRIRTRYLLL